MTRRITTRRGAAIALVAMILFAPVMPATGQGGPPPAARGASGNAPGNAPGNITAAPPQAQDRRIAPPIPNYYFDRSPVVRPKGPVGPAPNDVASSLRARGFRDIGPMQQRGSTSITEAVGPAGERVQLVIAPNGDIVGVRVLNPGER